MAPTCSNCAGTEFVWANEVKTGTGGGLSLRPKGEIPIGTRICKTCGHADLFLHDLSLLKNPHLWMPGEFYPISTKAAPAAPPPSAPAPAAPTAPVAPAPAPMAPAPAPEPEAPESTSFSDPWRPVGQ